MNAPRLAGHGVLLGCKSGDVFHVAMMPELLKRVDARFDHYSAKLTFFDRPNLP
jgi:hypothetical protein